MEEIIVGKIRSVSRDGVHGKKFCKCCRTILVSFFLVTLEFFDDVLIPPTMLQHPSRFDETEQAWIWEYDTGDGNKHDLFMDPGERIRFKVISENFTEISPTGPEVKESSSTTEPITDVKAAYSLTVRNWVFVLRFCWFFFTGKH